MKRCQTCNRTYTDDSLKYCLGDGSLLLDGPDPDATLVMPNPLSPVLPPRAAILSPPLQPSPSSYRWILYVAILLLTILVGAAAVALVYVLNKRGPPTSVARPSEIPTSVLPTRSPRSVPDKFPSPSPTLRKQVEPMSSGTQNLSGEWNVVNTVVKTSYLPFTNLQIGYHLVINQIGTNFTAEGEKLLENGQKLPLTGRTPIHVTGSIDGEMVGATFVEEGTRRKTGGRFVWRIEAGGARLSGTFVSTAASATGTSVATKER